VVAEKAQSPRNLCSICECSLKLRTRRSVLFFQVDCKTKTNGGPLHRFVGLPMNFTSVVQIRGRYHWIGLLMGDRVADGRNRGRMAAHERSSARAVTVATLLVVVPVLIGCSSSPGARSSSFDQFHSAQAAPAPAVSAPATANNAATVARPAVSGTSLMGTASAGTVLAGLQPPGFMPPTSSMAPLPQTAAPAAARIPPHTTIHRPERPSVDRPDEPPGRVGGDGVAGPAGPRCRRWP